MQQSRPRSRFIKHLISPTNERKPSSYQKLCHSPGTLHPAAVAKNREEYQAALSVKEILEAIAVEADLIDSQTIGNDNFLVDGYCLPCNSQVKFLVDRQSGGYQIGNGRWVPNWRERLQCPLCQMNNRQRLIAGLVKHRLDKLAPNSSMVYFMEQVTPIFSWAKNHHQNYNIVGSEYLGANYASGQIVDGVRHENVMALSFSNNSLDLIVSNDVFEHIPNPDVAFRECFRVLKNGGAILATIPIHSSVDFSIKRAVVESGEVRYILPPIFHGNPVSDQGSLVFTDFGWDIVGIIEGAGFSDVKLEIYADAELGHLGGGQIVFSAIAEKTSEIETPRDGAYLNAIRKENEIFENCVNVHDLPEIFHYWSGKHLAPIFDDAGISTMESFFADSLIKNYKPTEGRSLEFLSIGAGNGDIEVSVAKELLSRGFTDFHIECLEINEVMLQRGRLLAEQQDVSAYLLFQPADLNMWIARRQYDGVMANQSLHHVLNLEHLFGQIKSSLGDSGLFVISDIIGRNGHMRWPEAIEIINELWRELPDSHKYNHALQRYESTYENWDCSVEGFEGTRAQDILPLLAKEFEFESFIPFGNVIDIFVDRAFGHNFDRNSERDRAFIDRVHRIDEEGFQSGRLTPTHLMATLSKHGTNKPFISRGLAPEKCINRKSH